MTYRVSDVVLLPPQGRAVGSPYFEQPLEIAHSAKKALLVSWDISTNSRQLEQWERAVVVDARV
jgi:hypothetical protein